MKTFTLIIGIFLFSVHCLTRQEIKGTFAIQNIKTGMNLRPFDAGKQDNNKIVLYNHIAWKCMTWNFIRTDENTYQLKNLFTQKTFQPSADIQSGGTLVQKPLKPADEMQQWEFISAGESKYYIRLKGSDLYITCDPAGKINSDIILKQKVDSDIQVWRLIEQNPSM